MITTKNSIGALVKGISNQIRSGQQAHVTHRGNSYRVLPIRGSSALLVERYEHPHIWHELATVPTEKAALDAIFGTIAND